MLRYTARYILSRTLRTVLSKYLLDVEIDALAVPVANLLGSGAGIGGGSEHGSGGLGGSEYGAGTGGDGKGGGWGLKLSNVKLREGVELMTLPGRRRRTVRRTVKRMRRRKKKKKAGAARSGNDEGGRKPVELRRAATTIAAGLSPRPDELQPRHLPPPPPVSAPPMLPNLHNNVEPYDDDRPPSTVAVGSMPPPADEDGESDGDLSVEPMGMVFHSRLTTRRTAAPPPPLSIDSAAAPAPAVDRPRGRNNDVIFRGPPPSANGFGEEPPSTPVQPHAAVVEMDAGRPRTPVNQHDVGVFISPAPSYTEEDVDENDDVDTSGLLLGYDSSACASGYLSSPASRPPTPPPSYYCFNRTTAASRVAKADRAEREERRRERKKAKRRTRTAGDGEESRRRSLHADGETPDRVGKGVVLGEPESAPLRPEAADAIHVADAAAMDVTRAGGAAAPRGVGRGAPDGAVTGAAGRGGASAEAGGGGVALNHDGEKPMAAAVAPLGLHSPVRHGARHRAPVDDANTPYEDGDTCSDEETEEEEVETEVEEDVIDETEMVLRVGQGGRIGTLHVSFVGKELHVTVEDADLVVEATAKPKPKPEEGAGEDKTATGAAVNTKEDTKKAAASPGDTSADGTKTADTGKAAAEDDAAKDEGGMSSLARSLASIPNLFLRDCRVRLIINDDDDSDAEPGKQVDAGNEEAPGQEGENAGGTGNATVFVLGVDFLSVTSEGEDFLAHVRQGNQNDTGNGAKGASVANPSEVTADAAAAPRREPPSSASETPPPGGAATADGAAATAPDRFLTKRIRTGRGPEGGIYVQAFGGASPSYYRRPTDPITERGRGGDHDEIDVEDEVARQKSSPASPPPTLWAYDAFSESARNCLLRFSALDLHARIALRQASAAAAVALAVAKKEDLRSNLPPRKSSSWFAEEYEDYTIDSMLFGVDYVGAIPSAGREREVEKEPNHSATAANGDGAPVGISMDREEVAAAITNIETIPMPSVYHRMARGMRRLRRRGCARGQGGHSPLEDCSECWDDCSSDLVTAEGASAPAATHDLDAATPLPGLVLYVAAADPLEVNVDRPTLAALGLLQSLFSPSSSAPTDAAAEDARGKRSAQRDGETDIGRASPAPAEQGAPNNLEVAPIKRQGGGGTFPQFMRPDKVQVAGLHLVKVILRLHIMGDAADEDHLRSRSSFRYWEVTAHSVTIDAQSLDAAELAFHDVRVEVGRFAWVERRGVCRNAVLSLGREVSVDDGEDGEGAVAARKRLDNDGASAFPCAAAAILDIPGPHESLPFRQSDDRGVRLRCIHAPRPTEVWPSARIAPIPPMTCVDARVGFVEAAIASELSTEISATMDAAAALLSGGGRGPSEAWVDETTRPSESEEPSQTSSAEEGTSSEAAAAAADDGTPIVEYRLQFDGGAADVLSRTLRLGFPSTTFSGRRTAADGLAMDTVLNRLKFSYGKECSSSDSSQAGAALGTISIAQMAALPENVRMRVLFFLDDLGPLERALGLPETRNAFLRSHAINKKLTEYAPLPQQKQHHRHGAGASTGRRIRKKKKAKSKKQQPSGGRKEEILAQLADLDEGVLEAMLEEQKSKALLGRQQCNGT